VVTLQERENALSIPREEERRRGGEGERRRAMTYTRCFGVPLSARICKVS